MVCILFFKTLSREAGTSKTPHVLSVALGGPGIKPLCLGQRQGLSEARTLPSAGVGGRGLSC